MKRGKGGTAYEEIQCVSETESSDDKRGSGADRIRGDGALGLAVDFYFTALYNLWER